MLITEVTQSGISAYDVFGSAFILVALLGLALTIWALVDILKSNFADSNSKLIWVIVVLVANLIGSLVWLLWGRKTQRA